MNRKDVKIGEVYRHKHRLIRITEDLGTRTSGGSMAYNRRKIHRGWKATNLDSGRDIHVKSAAGLHPRTPPAGAVQRIQQATGQPERSLPLPSLDLHPVDLSSAITQATLAGDRTKVNQLVDLQEYLWKLVNHARSTGPAYTDHKLIWMAGEVQKLLEILKNDVAGSENILHYPLSTIEVR